jgi:hypothetical protein
MGGRVTAALCFWWYQKSISQTTPSKVSAYANMGRNDEAARALPGFIQARQDELNSRAITGRDNTVLGLAGDFRRMWRRPEDWNQLAVGLQEAGLPMGSPA